MTRNTFIMNNRGFSLLETIIVVTVMSIALASAAPNIVKGILAKYGTKTALDIATIQEAARAYIIDTKSWPTSINDLTADGKYLPANWNGQSPFKEPYTISSTPALLTISTIVPEGAQKVVANNLPASVVTGTTVTSSIGTPAGEVGIPIGSVIPWASNAVPSGWLLCNGQAVSRALYPDLFLEIMTRYGAGDGSTTFNLPDLRGRTIVGQDNMGGSNAGVITDSWGSTLGGKYGEERHQLTVAEMPSHRHYGFGENIANWPHGTYGPNNNQGPPDADFDNYLLGTTPTGGNGAHNIVQPSIALGYIIKAQ